MTPNERRVATQRARRHLAREGQRLTITRSTWDAPRIMAGDYVVIDIATNSVVSVHSSIEDLLKEIDA